MPEFCDERPLSLKVQLAENDPLLKAILATCGPLKPRVALMVAAIVANFRMAPSEMCFYSRDKNHYAAAVTRRYFPNYYTHAVVVQAVEALVRARLADDLRTLPSPHAKKRSRLRAAPRLLELFDEMPVQALWSVDSEPIVLKAAGRGKRWINYVETAETCAMRAQIRAFNTFQSKFDVRLGGEPHVMLSVAARQYHRVFNGDFSRGGRWYALWQNISKELRPSITIDGSPTSEVDFKCCHPRLLCALAGLQLPFEDPSFDFYDLPGFDRPLVKAAVNILLNASSPRAAAGALAAELSNVGLPDARALARILCRAVKAKWPALAPYWRTGIGLLLQNIDAAICSKVNAEMQRRGVPVLSIHDGFIVPAAFSDVLRNVVDAEMQAACCGIFGHLAKT